MEMEGIHHELLPQEVSMYLNWFDQADPTDVVKAHQELYLGRQAADPIRTMLYGHLQHALSLYPSYSLHTKPGRATELYASFVDSENTSDVLGMVSVLANLWQSDPRGATWVTKLCVTRQVKEPSDWVVSSAASALAKEAMNNNMWTKDEVDSVAYLGIERARREPPFPAS